jgi:hypothetical protein
MNNNDNEKERPLSHLQKKIYSMILEETEKDKASFSDRKQTT